jgi:adenosylcobinamide-GDP ribazoletransferase
MKKNFTSFWFAVQFLTRLPTPNTGVLSSNEASTHLKHSLKFFPLVGAFVGALTATIFWAANHIFPIWIAATLALICEALITGAFHEDAVADFFDAFGGGWIREDILRILKDSRIGTYGALGLMLAVALRLGLIIALDPALAFIVIIAAATIGRLCILFVMWLTPPIPTREGLANDVSGQVNAKTLLYGSLFALPAISSLTVYAPFVVPISIAACSLFCLWLSGYLKRRLGGVTGDCLGFSAYTGQLLVLLTFAAKI